MRYLIQPKDSDPFLTEWFSAENHYLQGMIVYDLAHQLWTKDGKKWKRLEQDQL